MYNTWGEGRYRSDTSATNYRNCITTVQAKIKRDVRCGNRSGSRCQVILRAQRSDWSSFRSGCPWRQPMWSKSDQLAHSDKTADRTPPHCYGPAPISCQELSILRGARIKLDAPFWKPDPVKWGSYISSPCVGKTQEQPTRKMAAVF